MKKKNNSFISICLISIIAVLFLPIVSLGEDDDKDHKWSEWITDKQPTCVSEGRKYRVCTKFPESLHYEQIKIPKLKKHNYNEKIIPATCTESKVGIYTCMYCGDSYDEIIAPPLGHDYGHWNVVRKATEEQEGSKEKICSHDPSHIVAETIPKLVPVEKPEKKVKRKVTPPPSVVAGESKSVETIPPNIEIASEEEGINTMDIVFSLACAGSIGLFWLLLLPDIYVVRWSRKLKSEARNNYIRRQHDNT